MLAPKSQLHIEMLADVYVLDIAAKKGAFLRRISDEKIKRAGPCEGYI